MTRSSATPACEGTALRATINYLLGTVVAFVALWMSGWLVWPDGWEVLVGVLGGGVVGGFIGARLKRTGSA